MKTLLNGICAAAGLIVCSPLLAGIAIVVRLANGPPILFKQQRTGLRGRPFDLYKFRTMRSEPSGDGMALPDEARLTRVGQFMRRFSLDELPQLYNVVRGEIAFVGPRPLMHTYWERGLYSAEQARRFDAKPGLTGWAQVNGRNSLSWEEKFELDVWYVEHRTLRLDLKILVKTVAHVLHGGGVSQHGHATAEEFTGSKESANMRS